MNESIALVEFSKHSEKFWSKPFDYAHIEVGLKIWNPHRPRPTTGACADSATWYTGKKKKKQTCAWVAQQPAKRCKATITSKDGASARDACPAACGACSAWSYSYSYIGPTTFPTKEGGDSGAFEGGDNEFTEDCRDSTTWSVKNRKGKTITCKKVRRSKIKNGERRRCSLKGAREACAKSCGTC